MGITKLRAVFGSRIARSTSEFDASARYHHTLIKSTSRHVGTTFEPFLGANVHEPITPEIEAQIKRLRQQAGDAWIDHFVLFHDQAASHAELQRANEAARAAARRYNEAGAELARLDPMHPGYIPLTKQQ